MIKTVIYLFVILTCICCSSQRGDDAADFNEKIMLGINQIKIIGRGDHAIIIKLRNIRDNRCPAGVQCVWEGYVNVEFELASRQKEKAVFALCLGRCENINEEPKLNVILGVKAYRIILYRVGEDKKVVVSIERI